MVHHLIRGCAHKTAGAPPVECSCQWGAPKVRTDCFMNPTLQDVADRVGLTRSGVSRALRNDPSIPQATRDRVQQAAIEIGYRPNPYISTLMASLRTARPTEQRAVIGFVTNFQPVDAWKRLPFLRRFYSGTVERAAELGYQIEEFPRRAPGMTVKRLQKILYTRNVRGLILAPTQTSPSHLQMDYSSVACVTIGYSVWRPHVSRAVVNHVQGVAEAIRHLHRLGYEKIGMAVHQHNDDRVNRGWSAGYLSRLRVPEEADRHRLLLAPDWEYIPFIRWLRANKPDVVISPHIETLIWLRTAGFKVPQEVGFVCLDWSDMIEPCAGVNQNMESVGGKAVDMVVFAIQRNEFGIPNRPVITETECSWVNGPTVRRISQKPTGKKVQKESVAN